MSVTVATRRETGAPREARELDNDVPDTETREVASTDREISASRSEAGEPAPGDSEAVEPAPGDSEVGRPKVGDFEVLDVVPTADGSLQLLPETDHDVADDAEHQLIDGAPVANHVQLRGRISHIDEPRVLPSGDTVVQLRLVVPRDRPTPRRDGASVRSSFGVDTIDVACWTPTTQRAATRVGVDGHAEVTGVLRRRFFRSGGGPASRYEVEARRLRRVAAPTPTTSAAPTAPTSTPTPKQADDDPNTA